MYPHQPQPHQQGYYPPLQSRGFNPPPQQARPPQQAPYQQAQPSASGQVHQYQAHSQHHQQLPGQYYQQTPGFSSPQQQRVGQYYAQTQGFSPPPPQRYAPQPYAVPHPPQVAPPVHSQGRYPLAPAPSHPSYVPFASHPQPPVVPPVRANSQSPDKSRRPLPAPAPGTGSRQSPTMAFVAPINGYVAPAQSHGISYAPQTPYTHANPPASSFATTPASKSFPLGQSFQTPTQVQPLAQPLAHHIPPTHAHPSVSRSHTVLDGTPPASPARTPDSPSKRPLPAPPGNGAVASPPMTPSRSGPVAPGIPAAAPHAQGSPAQRRALPFSPTQPPSAEAGRSTSRSPIRLPQRSSTLPSPLTPPGDINGPASSRSRDDTGQPSIPLAAFATNKTSGTTETPTPPRSTGFVPPPSAPSKPSTGFTLPQQQQKPTQSLAFRIASLSLREEQARTQPIGQPAPRTSPDPAPFSGRSAVLSSSRSPARPAINLDDVPPSSSMRLSSSELKSASNAPRHSQPRFSIPTGNAPSGGSENKRGSDEMSVRSTLPSISVFEVPTAASELPSINVSEVPAINVSETPSINISEAPFTDSMEGPSITVSEATPKITVSELPATSFSSAIPDIIVADLEGTLDTSVNAPAQKRKGLICYGCGNGILGRIVSAMGGRWHPSCFKCTVCNEMLEHVSSYEHAGKPYCHLDYHEKFAPQCYHCRTPIVDERFITLDDPALGKRMYHEQHFFCAECGDPFLAPRIPEKQKDASMIGTVMQEDDVGFTVYKGHPYCEACHVRLRYPKCKRCKKSIRDGMRAVEALGGKWCWECFLCAGCEKPFDSPAFFQRDTKAFCEACFSVIIKSEL